MKLTSLEFPLDLKAASLVRKHPSPPTVTAYITLGGGLVNLGTFRGFLCLVSFIYNLRLVCFPYFPSLCACMCVLVHMYVQMYMHMCAYTCGSKRTPLDIVPQEWPILPFCEAAFLTNLEITK